MLDVPTCPLFSFSTGSRAQNVQRGGSTNVENIPSAPARVEKKHEVLIPRFLELLEEKILGGCVLPQSDWH
jgi:hypothetical protein